LVNRRSFAKLAGAAALAAIPAVHLAGRVAAGRTWCRMDPVVKIDGKTADIWLASDTALNDTATGPAQIVVAVPVGVPAEILAVDRGFGGLGYDVQFVEDSSLGKGWSGPQVRVRVYVPSSDGSLPLTVSFLPRSSGLGMATSLGLVNTWIKLRTA
jgi:hypothetical protein